MAGSQGSGPAGSGLPAARQGRRYGSGQPPRRAVRPATRPETRIGPRIGGGVGWTTLAAAEMVAAQAGLGQCVPSTSNILRADVVAMGSR